MTEKLNAKRLEELGESEYRELESVYGKLKDLRASIAQMHDDLVKEATPPTFDKLEAIYLMVEDVFAGLERYLLPECDPNSAFEPVRREE